MKRLLSMILCVLMLISAVPAMAVMADEPAAKAFDDVKPGKWYYEGVMWCAEQGYMAGIALDDYREGMDDCILFCATERRTKEQIDELVKLVKEAKKLF